MSIPLLVPCEPCRFRWLVRPLLIAVAGVVLTGCGSPPSVVPMLTVVDRALTAEARHLETDGELDAQLATLMRRVIDDGFARDLEHSPVLTVDWVREAATGYTAAREAVLRQEMGLAAARSQRRANLEAAARMQRQAVALLTYQDKLLRRTLGLDLWRLDADLPNPTPNPPETQR